MRINIITPKLLTDQHLIAEYNELQGMLPTYYRRSVIERVKPFNDNEIPTNYTMGKGHAMFFYNKILFAKKRWLSLKEECKSRNINVTIEDIKFDFDIREEHLNDWVPSKDDILINIERILNRIYKKIVIDNKPNFYKFNSILLPIEEYFRLYKEELDIDDNTMLNIKNKIISGKAI